MNYEMERTEELIIFAQQKRRKKRLKIAGISIAIVALAAGIVAGILIHNDTKNKEIDKLMMSAQKNLEEGKYEQAIEAFDEVIKLDDRNATAYEGRGDARVKIAKTPEDYKSAVKDYDKAYQNTDKKDADRVVDKGLDAAKKSMDPKLIETYEDRRKKTKESSSNNYTNLGNTPEGIAAGGIVCEKDGKYYVANNPKRGQISELDSNGKVTKTIFEYKDLDPTQYISRLNVWDGWIYYAVVGVVEEDDIAGPESGQLRRVKLDGTEDEEIAGMGNQDFDSLAIINGKFYYSEDHEDRSFSVNECALNGKEKRTISKDGVFGKTFTTDGQNVIYGRESEVEDDINLLCDLVKINLNHPDGASLIKKEQGSIFDIVQSNGKICYAEDFNGAPNKVTIVDTATNKLMPVEEFWDEERLISTINATKENIIVASDYSYAEEDDERLNNGYNAKFYFINPKNGQLDNSKSFTLRIADSDIVNLDEAHLEYMFVLNDKIFYQIMMGPEELPLFGVVSIDGKDNKFYGND